MKHIKETDQEYICDIQAPCFQNLSNEEVELIKESKTQLLFRKGENLTKQGSFANYILFITSGYVKQFIEAEGGRNLALKIYSNGEFIGISSVFMKSIFPFSSVALTDVHAILIEKDVMEKVMKQNGNFSFSIIKKHCETNNVLYDTIKTIYFKQMNGRMADVLLYFWQMENSGNSIIKILSRKDIAEFAGISTENAVKIIKTLEKEGVINLELDNKWLLDEKKLNDLSFRG